jgi:Ca-activated chloride channel family protein
VDPADEERVRQRIRIFWNHLFPYLALLGLATLTLALIQRHLGLPLGRLTFAHRWALLLLLAVPLAAYAAFHAERRRQGTFLFSRVADLVAVGPGLLARLRSLPAVLRILGLGFFVVALARPESSKTLAHEEAVEGIDIVFALDVSLSMQETDMSTDPFERVTRIEAAKKVIDDFIRKRKHDRIGLVLFGAEAHTWCPPTLDYQALRSLLADVNLGVINGQATAIGDAIGTAVNRLRRSKSSSKVIILLTDGDSNAGSITPNQAANYAATFKIKVFTVLAGKHAADHRFGMRRFRVNPRLLEEIAALTGGTPYLASDREALQDRFQRILDALKKDRFVRKEQLTSEHFQAFLYPGLLFILLDLLLGLTVLRRFP